MGTDAVRYTVRDFPARPVEGPQTTPILNGHNNPGEIAVTFRCCSQLPSVRLFALADAVTSLPLLDQVHVPTLVWQHGCGRSARLITGTVRLCGRPNGGAMPVFAVTTAKGSNWDHARDIREQPFWDQHAAFADTLTDRGVIILGGPVASDDDDIALLAVEAPDEEGAAVDLPRRPVDSAPVVPDQARTGLDPVA